MQISISIRKKRSKQYSTIKSWLVRKRTLALSKLDGEKVTAEKSTIISMEIIYKPSLVMYH